MGYGKSISSALFLVALSLHLLFHISHPALHPNRRSHLAGARFTNSVIRALNGETGVVEPTFVESPLYTSEGVKYFASNVELGKEGVAKIHPVGQLSAEEEELLKACLPE